MHIHTLENWRHGHDFTLIHEKGERRTKQVLVLTVITMAGEIFAGTVFGSMALLADGWHMGTHAAAFTITIFAYRYSQKHASDRRFTFGTGKVSVLGGFASAILLDNNIDLERKRQIRKIIESDSHNRVSDIHVWKVGPASYAAMIPIVTHLMNGLWKYRLRSGQKTDT